MIFASYDHRDRDRVRPIVDRLIAAGHRVWFDEYEILPGDSLTEKIMTGIAEASFFLVFLSKHSVTSPWVTRETQAAFEKNPEASTARIIPVRLDPVDLPSFFHTIRYIDYATNPQVAQKELIHAVSTEPKDKAPISDLVDTKDLSQRIQHEIAKTKGSGYPVSIAIGILSLILAAVFAVPSFVALVRDRSKVVYSVQEDRLSIPRSLDVDRIRQLMASNGVPDGGTTIVVANKGLGEAKKIKVGVRTPSPILTVETQPPTNAVPIWVRLEQEATPTNQPAVANFILREFAATPDTVSIAIGYFAPTNQAHSDVDVIADGQPAQRVSDVSEVQRQNLLAAFTLPLWILAGGFLLAILGGVAVVLARSPRLRDALVIIMREVSPATRALVDILSSVFKIL